MTEKFSRETIEIVEELFEDRPKFKKREGMSPLHVALVGDAESPEVIKLLLEKGEDVNARDRHGKTPLHFATKEKTFGDVSKEILLSDWETWDDAWRFKDECEKNLTDFKEIFSMEENDKGDDKTLEIVKLLLDNGADVNVHDENGLTPLHNASLFKTSEIVEFLLDRGADIEARDNFGDTALHWAVSFGAPATEKLLLDRGANATARRKDGHTPLDICKNTYLEQTDVFKMLESVFLRQQALNKLLYPNFWQEASPKQVNEVIESGADIQATDDEGNTPLHLAFQFSITKQVLEPLLLHGGDTFAKNNDGNTPIELVGKNEHLAEDEIKELIQITQPRRQKEAFLVEVFENENTDAQTRTNAYVDLLLLQGEERQIRLGEPPLHMAIIINDTPEVIKLLLEKGEDIEARDRYWNRTPLHHAVGHKKATEVIALLLDRGANIDAQDGDKSTPLHLASGESETPEAVEILLNRGANINSRDYDGDTPLHEAAFFGIPEIVALLLDKGANPKSQNEKGQTPFDYAKETENLQGTDAFKRLEEAQHQ